MILKKLTLTPFAGITYKEVAFKEGLNILVGPNEAGKSTLAKAIYYVLFEPTNLTKQASKNQFKPIGPARGGDTVKVILEFEANGVEYTLIKNWGATPFSQLTDSKGISLTDPDSVNQTLETLLRLNTATWRDILFAQQSLLSETIQELADNNELSGSFSDLLRSAVLLQGGISSAALQNDLEETVKLYYNNWDVQLRGPVGNRGIDNRHQKSVGIILKAYYSWKETVKELAERNEYDELLDRISAELEVCNDQVNELASYIDIYKPAYEDAGVRNELLAWIENQKQIVASYRKKAMEWPTAISDRSTNQKTILDTTKKMEELQKELEVAQKKEIASSKTELLRSLQDLKAKAEHSKQVYDEVVKVHPEHIEQVKNKEEIRSKNTITLEAKQLRMRLVAKKDILLKWRKGAGEQEEKQLVAGAEMLESIPGKVQLETDDLSLEIISGKEDVDVLIAALTEAEQDLKDIFQKYRVAGLTEFNDLISKESFAKKTYTDLARDFKTLLGKHSFEELSKEAEEINKLPSVREKSLLEKELRSANTDLEMAKGNLQKNEEIIRSLISDFQTQEQLTDKQVDATGELKRMETTFANLAPLPEGVTSSQAFTKEFKEKADRFEKLKEKQAELLRHKAVHEAKEPDKSVAELTEEANLNEQILKRKLEEGDAYKKIQTAFTHIIETEASDIYEPYHRRLSGYFEAITSGKYTAVVTDEIVPEAVSDGETTLSRDLLSEGTKDALALALRLTMADHYLHEQRGFLIMDDPLTEMDVARREKASNCIQQFAEQKQVIIFTCHEEHAKSLNGNRIDM